MDFGFCFVKGLILALDDDSANCPLALFVSLDASFQRHIEKYQGRRNLELFGQVQQIFARQGGERGRVNYTQAVHCKSLFQKEIRQCEGLRVKTLIALVIANSRASPIRRNYLGRPEVPFRKS
jgi:hypothetical protein